MNGAAPIGPARKKGDTWIMLCGTCTMDTTPVRRCEDDESNASDHTLVTIRNGIVVRVVDNSNAGDRTEACGCP